MTSSAWGGAQVTQCWFWNIEARKRDLFWREIEDGRLRQGWSSSAWTRTTDIASKASSTA
jgi:hypothetical protein